MYKNGASIYIYTWWGNRIMCKPKCYTGSSKIPLFESPLHSEAPYWELSDTFCTLDSNQTLYSINTVYYRVINTSCRWMKKHLMNWGQKEMSGCMMHEKCNWAVYKTWLSGLPSCIPMWGDCFLPQAEWWSAFTESDNFCNLLYHKHTQLCSTDAPRHKTFFILTE